MNNKPLYIKISDILREEIKNQKYNCGDKLPSENMLATKYKISRLTARQALTVLVNENLIEKFQGKGYFCKKNSSGKKIHVLLDMTDYYFIPYYIQSISHILEKNGAVFIAVDTKNSYEEIIKALEKILATGSDGIILQVSPEEQYDKGKIEGLFKKLKEQGIPFIQIDTEYGVNDVSYAIMNETKMGVIAAEYFKSQGHNNVGAIYVENNRISALRMNSFVNQFEKAVIIYDDNNLKDNLFKAYKKGITGIFCYSDFVAKKCIDALSSLEISIPEDISVITADDTLVSKLYNLTAVTHAKESLGEFAAKTILDRNNITQKIFDTYLIKRDSVKKLTTD